MNKALITAFLLFAGTVALAGPSEGRLVAFLSQQVAKDADNPELYLRRANAYGEIAHWEEALADLEQAEALGMPNAAALARGNFLSRMGELDRARKQFDALIAAQPGNYRAILHRADVLLAQNKTDAALADYLKLFELKPDAASGYYRQAAQLLHSNKQSEKALQLLDQRMNVTGPIPQLQNIAIEIEQENKHYQAAVGRLQSLNPLIQGTPFWNAQMAKLYLLDSKPSKAAYHLSVAEALLRDRRQTRVNQRLGQELLALKSALVQSRAAD